MFGYRARIGYISPSVIELNGYDFYRIVPDGVGLIAVACMVGGWKEEAYKEALKQVEGCAKELARRKCDFVIHGGAPLVLSQGKGFETELVDKYRRLRACLATRASSLRWMLSGISARPGSPWSILIRRISTKNWLAISKRGDSMPLQW